MTDKAKKILVFLCLVALLTSFVSVVYLSSYWRLCYKTSEKPAVNGTDLPIVFSKDARVVLRFGGYLTLKNNVPPLPVSAPNDTKPGIEFMQLEAISQLQVTSKNNTNLLEVSTICGQVSMLFATDQNKLVCNQFIIDLGANGYCLILAPGIEAKAHYACYKERVFQCQVITDKSLVQANTFHMIALEFEIDKENHENKHHLGKFEAPQELCNDTIALQQ